MWVAHLKDTLQSSRATKLVLTRRVNLKGEYKSNAIRRVGCGNHRHHRCRI